MPMLLEWSRRGDAEARQILLSRPEIHDEAQPYWEALADLERGRPIAGGMVPLPLPLLPRDIREEGQRRGYEGDSLEEFYAIVTACGDHRHELLMKRLAAEARRQAPETRRR